MMWITSGLRRVAAGSVLIWTSLVVSVSGVTAQDLSQFTALATPSRTPLELPAKLNVDRVPLERALLALETRSGVSLVYSPSKLPRYEVTCHCSSLRVGEALGTMLEGRSLRYTVHGEHIIIENVQLPASPQLVEPIGRFASAPAPATTSVPTPKAWLAETASESRTSRRAPRLSGSITGTVVNAETGQRLGGVQVFVEGSGRGTITRADGTFLLVGVPVGTHTLVAQSIGYQTTRLPAVQVTEGGTTTVSMQLQAAVLMMQEIVATGLIDPVEGVRSPITVATVTREMMPVMPTGSAVVALQGSVAGAQVVRQSGQPGTEVPIMLRTPTSIRLSNTPLLVVDGVILGSNSVDIESLDVESIEVIKGAAAASLYGSRAAAGVISIRTNRGSNLAAGQTRFTARSEYGASYVGNFEVPQVHFYEINPVTGNYVNRAGRDTTRAGRYEATAAFMDKPFPAGTQLFDNINSVYSPGRFNTQSFSIAQNSESTNFAASLTRNHEPGAIVVNNGYQRNSARVNLSHRFLGTMNLDINAYHARAQRDEFDAAQALLSSVYWAFLAAPVDIDVTLREADGTYAMRPDPTSDYESPLWRQQSRTFTSSRNRTLGSAEMRWNPWHWFTAGGNVSYDREDTNNRFWIPRGTAFNLLDSNQPWGRWGWLQHTHNQNDTFNGSAQGSVRWDFGVLNIRTTGRGVYEHQDVRGTQATAQNFLVNDVPRLNATPADNQTNTSFTQGFRSLGYLWDTALDYDGKYIGTILVRRDGSSLFGPENRWHNYYRVAGAWRLSEEDWFNVPSVTEFKLRAAQGTAGGRPPTSARFETWSVTSSGVAKGQLGNLFLRPEHTVEREVGLEMILGSRIGIELVHARQTTSEQLFDLPTSAITGYSTQWVNSGQMKGHTTELSVQANLVSNPRWSWTSNLLADRSRSHISQWDNICLPLNVSHTCEGVSLRDIYGFRFYRGERDQLPAWLSAYSNEFDVNDEGYTVWVGAGNSWRDGIAKNLWGTTRTIEGFTYQWGHPIVQRDQSLTAIRQKLASGDPDLNLGWINSVRFGNFTFHGHLHAALGQYMLNDTRKNLTVAGVGGAGRNAMQMVQTGKADEEKKPVQYYTVGLLQGGIPSEEWLENNSYLKLRSVMVGYRVRRDQLQRLGLDRVAPEALQLSLQGRDLFTWTNYWGFDPEAGLIQGGTLAENRVQPLNWYAYPPTRSFTASIELTF